MKQILVRALARAVGGERHKRAAWRLLERAVQRVFPTNKSGNNTSMR